MVLKKQYKTPKAISETEFTVNKSRFIGRCFPVSDEKEAFEKLEYVRRLNADATHNCWAYNLCGGIRRFSDDGEPGGTAGMPIMDTLIRSETEDALIVVTRYFGGILLGSGGLVRAYSKSAADALKASGISIMINCKLIEFTVEYSRYGALENYIRENSVEQSAEFLENICFRCFIEYDKAAEFTASIIERTDGRSVPRCIGEKFLRKDI